MIRCAGRLQGASLIIIALFLDLGAARTAAADTADAAAPSAAGSAATPATPGAAGNTATPATPTAAGTAASATASGSTAEPLPTVVVTGLRASLGKSLEIKENADVVSDSINALELGRFPDDDVADSLRHITGVTITRTTGGEGLYIGIRGLGSQYNIVTLNNRILATDDDGRDLAFDILPADVISGADVLKSSQASAIEGSIGGTVNLRSARPFDDPGLHTAVRIERSYDDMSEFWGTRGSGFISNTNSAGTFGVLLGGVASKVETRSDSLNYNTYDPSNPGSWPILAGGQPAPNAQPVVAECCISFGSIVDTKKREAGSLALQWRPNDRVQVTLDGLYAYLNDPQIAYDQAYYPDFNLDQNGLPEWSHVVVNNGLITSFVANHFTPEIVNNTIDRVVTTSMAGLNVAWQPSSRLSLAGDLYRSRANRPEGGNDSFVTSGLESPTPYNQDTISWANTYGGLPNIAVTLPNGQDYATALANGTLNNNYWTAHYTGLNGYSIHDTVIGALFDGTYAMDGRWLRELRFGVSQTWRTKSRDDYNNDWTNGSSQYDFYVTPPGANPITYGSLGANVISTTTFPNYMQGAGGSFPQTVAVFNLQTLLAALKSLNGKPNLYGTTSSPVFDYNLTLPQLDLVNSYDVHENTSAAYFETAFRGSNWSGNLGLRLIYTHTNASTAVNNIESVTVANTADPTSPAIVVYSPATPTSATNSYTVPLPSMNLLYHYRPDLQLRFGAAETITRPNLSQLAPTRTDNSLNRVYEVTYAGNPDLHPIRSYSADISLEWYYQPKSALTLALFGKNIRDFITQLTLNNVDLGVQGFFNGSTTPVPVPYTVYVPVNGDKAYVRGLELAWQHIFPSGFGLHGEYTRTTSEAYVQGQYVGLLEGVSPNAASASVLYENARFSANVTWDYDGPAVAQTFTEVPGWAAWQRSFNWVTAQASYEFLQGFKVYVSGKNLTNAIARTYLLNRSDAIWAAGNTGTSSAIGQGYSAYGRVYTLGMSYRF